MEGEYSFVPCLNIIVVWPLITHASRDRAPSTDGGGGRVEVGKKKKRLAKGEDSYKSMRVLKTRVATSQKVNTIVCTSFYVFLSTSIK